MKAIVRLLYFALRTLFSPLLLLFGPTGIRPEAIVCSATVSVFIFIVQPMTASRLGGGYAIVTTTIGGILGYAFLVWGKEFERDSKQGSTSSGSN
jgi:hypothetical protein